VNPFWLRNHRQESILGRDLDFPTWRKQLKLTKNLGMLLLGAWLILTGLLQFVHIPITDVSTILALLAIAAGVLILIGR
jgi:hypothetical protein